MELLIGDLLVVHKTQQVHNGQIVVACINGEVTIKCFKQVDSKIELIAENSEFELIIMNLRKQTLIIEGLAVGIIRNSNSF